MSPQALYASKICSYAQGMNLIKAASTEFGWKVDLAECARIWKGGCIIRAGFLDRSVPNNSSLLLYPPFLPPSTLLPSPSFSSLVAPPSPCTLPPLLLTLHPSPTLVPCHRIQQAYSRNPDLKNLLVDPDFAAELNAKQASWRRIVSLCVASGIAAPAFSSSLGYFDSYRRARLPANLTQVRHSHRHQLCQSVALGRSIRLTCSAPMLSCRRRVRG